MESKSDLLRTLAAISGAKSAAGGVRSSVQEWRATTDSDDHYVYAVALSTKESSYLERCRSMAVDCSTVECVAGFEILATKELI